MFRIALKSVLARKRRLLLTSIAILLGVAFISGTSNTISATRIAAPVKRSLRRFSIAAGSV